MGVIATDNFDRANNADLGASWAVLSGANALSIASNLCKCTADQSAERNTATLASDQYAQVVLKAVLAGAGAGIGPSVRAATGAFTVYFFIAGGTDSKLYKLVGGSYTLLGSGAACAADDVLYISAVGTSIEAKKNTVSHIGPATDSSIASGFAGVWANFNTANCDDWECGDFAGATFIPRPTIISQAVHRAASW